MASLKCQINTAMPTTLNRFYDCSNRVMSKHHTYYKRPSATVPLRPYTLQLKLLNVFVTPQY